MHLENIQNLIQEHPQTTNLFKKNLVKEYLQILILSFIYGRADYQDLVFYGGSCLKHCYGLPRLSEDLDFADTSKEVNLKKLANELKKFLFKQLDIAPLLKVQKFRIYLKLPLLKKLELADRQDSDLLFLKVEIFKQFDFCVASETQIIPIFKNNQTILVKSFDLPTLMAFGLAWIVAERYVYFGSLGIIIVFVLLWHALNEKIFATKKMYWFIGILIVLAIGARTIIRNQDWKNQDTLWIATVKVAPSGQVIHNNLGDMYGRRKQYDKAIKEFLTAIAINPRYADAMHNLANTYLEINNTEQAIYWYNEAIKFGPHLWQSYQNLGMIYYQLGELKKAEELFARAVEINPNNENLRDTLEIIRAQKI